MQKMSKFARLLFLSLAFLLLEMIMPSHSFALGGTYIRSFGEALLFSFVLMIVSLIYLIFIKKQKPHFVKQLIYFVSFFFFLFLTSWYVFYKIEMHYTEPRIFFVEVAEFGNITQLEQLLNQGTNPNVVDLRGESALGCVARMGDLEKTKLLLIRGANINIKNKEGETPLMLAASRGYTEIIQFLLQNNAKIDDKDNDGRTALMNAVIQRHPEAVKILLERGANINARNNDGETALMEAALRGRIESLPLLIKNGAEINAQDNKGRTALYDAIMCCFPDAAEMLLGEGANMNIKDKNGWSAKNLAKYSGKKELIDIFIKAEGGNIKIEKNSR